MNTLYLTQFFLTATKAVPTVLWGLMIAGSIAPAIAQQTVYPMTTNSGSMNPNQTLKVTGLEVQQEGTFGKNVFVAKKIFLETFKDLPSQNPSKDYFAIIDGATGQLKRGAEITGPGGGPNNTVGSGGVANGLDNTPLAGTFWTIGGNTISATTTGINTLTTNDYFGIKNFAPLIFVTNNIPRVWITETGNVGVGKDNPVEKLEVEGNVRVSGNVAATNITAAGNVTASNVNTFGMTVTGQANFDSLRVANTIRTNRISPLPGDSLIHFGNNSIVVHDALNSIFSNTSNTSFAGTISGIGIGFPAISKGTGSTAIGTATMVESNALNSVVIGSGIVNPGFGNFTFLKNDKPNSLMVGFNSDKPTLYVGPSDGINTSGNVGVGTSSPGTKLHVESSDPATTIQSSTPVLYLRNATTQPDALTSISFRGSTLGGASYPTAQIGTINTPGSGVASGEIYFATTKLNGALAEAMRITSGGNIGIGTATPKQLVELRSAESTTRLRITNDAGPANGGLEFYAGASFKGGFFFNGGGKVMSFYGPAGTSGVINMHDNDDIVFNQGSTAAEWVRIKEGNVGIGTTTPRVSLEVNGHFHLRNGNNAAVLSFPLTGNQANLFIRSDDDPSTYEASSERMIIMGGSGNVGIGTTDPKAHLHISGTGNQFLTIISPNTLGNSEVSIGAVVTSGIAGQIDYRGKFVFHEMNNNKVPLVIENDGSLNACKVVVSTAFGCDFVFDKDYNLRSLKKRKETTFKNKRLLNMKSAKEMVEKGVDLGETTIGILQNVEEHELFLYRHDEKIETLYSMLEQYKNEIERMKKELEDLKNKRN